jgi:Uma2 family endonuclease
MALPRLESLSLAEYFASEAQRGPCEYLDGQIYPLSEPSPAHKQLQLNLEDLLRPAAVLEGSRLYTQMKLKLGHNRVYYPDLMIVNQPSSSSQYVEYPALVIEIATWETERTDRGEKLLTYQQIPALQGYLIVHAERRVVEWIERGLRGNWHYSAFGNEGSLELYSPQIQLDLADIYQGL